ncbi:MAG: L-threonylcarbamoyladenylate synthase [Bdellovibrionales bacterium]
MELSTSSQLLKKPKDYNKSDVGPITGELSGSPEIPAVEFAALLLSLEHNVGMPTETVYGLAASIHSQKALENIFSLKERPFFDPLIVHVSNRSQLTEVVGEWSSLSQMLSEEFWPGPLTLVVPKKKELNALITSGLETVAVRMPSHPMAQEMIERLGHPVAAPSANKFGKTSPTRAEHVEESFPNLYVLPSGPSEWGVESTVIQIEGEKVFLLRPGAITQEDLDRVLNREGYEPVIVSEKVNSPGHLKHHYQPEKPLFIIRTPKSLPRQVVGEIVSHSLKGEEISLSPDPRIAARGLYSQLREKSQSEADYLYLVWPNHFKGDLWEAIWDRVKRAATEIVETQ